MYYLATLLDNRKYHIAHLHPADNEPAKALLPSFVLEHQAGQERSLLSIIRQAKLIRQGGYLQDRWIDWASLTTEQTTEGVVLHIKATAQEPNAEPALPDLPPMPVHFRHTISANRFELFVSRHYTATSLTVTLSVEVDATTYHSQLLIHLVPQKQIFDIVMDFGSEASQIVTYRRGGTELISRVPMVDNLIDYFYPDFRGKSLHQQDINGEKDLYRSAFFVKKAGAAFDPSAKPGIHGDNEFLNLLTDRAQKNKLTAERMLVSNLKLAHLGAYNFDVRFAAASTNAFGVTQKRFLDTIVQLQQAVINYFMQTVLEEIRRSTREQYPLYVVVKLLVPNVFEQRKVSKLLSGTARGLAEMATNFPHFNLKGAEVSTISESDASFLGFKSEQDELASKGEASVFEQSGRYLIIDVGKGTTDFSILEFTADTSRLSSLYRSGFIGAGNILSYAFIDTVFTAICGTDEDDRKRGIQAVTQRADIADKLQFVEAIEKLKQAYDPTRTYQSLADLVDFSTIRSQLADTNESGTLGAIATLLDRVSKKQGSIGDEWLIINRTVTDIATRIHREVLQSGHFHQAETGDMLVKKIILTGRGFLFAPLRNAISKVFAIPTILTSDLKRVCLQGAFSSNPINYESNLVGFPNVYQLFGRPGRQSKQIDTGNGNIVNIPMYSRMASWLTDKTKALREKEDDFAEGHLTAVTHEPTAVEKRVDLSKEEAFLNWGEKFDEFNRHAKVISICGLDYKNHSIDASTVNLFYTGEEFIIRAANRFDTLRIEPRFFQTTQLVAQTLYPFADIQQPAEVRVMALTDSF